MKASFVRAQGRFIAKLATNLQRRRRISSSVAGLEVRQHLDVSAHERALGVHPVYTLSARDVCASATQPYRSGAHRRVAKGPWYTRCGIPVSGKVRPIGVVVADAGFFEKDAVPPCWTRARGRSLRTVRERSANHLPPAPRRRRVSALAGPRMRRAPTPPERMPPAAGSTVATRMEA